MFMSCWNVGNSVCWLWWWWSFPYFNRNFVGVLYCKDLCGLSLLYIHIHAWVNKRAWFRLSKEKLSSTSSRYVRLNLSIKPFWEGLPFWINFRSISLSSHQFFNALAINSGPLSTRRNNGFPRQSINSFNCRITRLLLILVSRVILRHSRLKSSMILKDLNFTPWCKRSSIKSILHVKLGYNGCSKGSLILAGWRCLYFLRRFNCKSV